MTWTRLVLEAKPNVLALSVADAKVHLRIDGNDSDADVLAAVNDAASYIEGPNGKGLALTTQTWKLSLMGFGAGPIVLPIWPVQSVESIEYQDGDGVTQTLDPAAYVADVVASPAAVYPAWGATFPSGRSGPGAVIVTFKAGFGDAASDVPGALTRAMRLLVGHFFEYREGQAMPDAIDNLIAKYAVGTI
jgi:uncharacterized phiE125 gp8 family phage protein